MLNGLKLICSNNNYDFYIKKEGRDWFCYAYRNGNSERVTMAGFNTKKSAVTCAHKWSEWMK